MQYRLFVHVYDQLIYTLYFIVGEHTFSWEFTTS